MNQFASDVLEGLSAQPKRLSSKYFYDQKGDELFQQIMALDEYYLTRTEYSILDQFKAQVLDQFKSDNKPFNLIEFGAGDGYKTKVLLRHFLEQKANFCYMPIDISSNVLEQLETSLKVELPALNVTPICNHYFEALEELKEGKERNVILFLGSNIGNFTAEQADSFLKGLNAALKEDDILFIGFDLKKDPEVILNAYNDKQGVTAAFNFNLLDRINSELGGNFNTSQFRHYPIYNPMTGTTTSYLISEKEQTVEIMDAAIHFRAWEPIHMEISQKYDQVMINEMAKKADFEIIDGFTDDKKYFLSSVWRK
ncbi:L-histidine N(alpha)-methyltransferase [Fulvivirga lutimaris]|uniref:L-histidine N(alpha)-methyltransferase n=1 Tax=Fulvivirga lutimaris TaxID=1819566 RepID=UPI0012BD7589|nr:L-histidine N(alpha)-methyltransferase [Fulvivirga lutimaris]MTI40251.1 L-histidine N(alpha)-methyltransferase [Fulvivirga lutimaris]